MIEVEDFTKRYGARTAVDAVSFQVHLGTVTCFLGPNGAGNPVTELRLSSRAVSVGAVRDGGDDDRDLLVLDQVQHPVFAPACRILRRERLKERLADPVRVLRQRAVDELPARGRDLLGHPLQRPHCRWAQHDPVAHRARFPRTAMRASSVAMQTGSGRPRACMSATTSASSPISTPCARAAMIFSISAAVT